MNDHPLTSSAFLSAVARIGGANLARALNISPQAVSKYCRVARERFDFRVPSEHVLTIARETDWRVTPHQLRPDLYPNPDDGMPMSMRGSIGAEAAAAATAAPSAQNNEYEKAA